MLIAVGSENPAKVSATKIGFKKIFPFEKIKVVGTNVNSKVSRQPMSDRESIRGATNRAKAALKAVKDADFGVGMEGGVHKHGKYWIESGWIVVINKEGKIGIGSSARWQVSNKIMSKFGGETELAHIFEELAGIKNAKDAGGVMALVTKNHLPRDIAYSHGVIFALAPFYSDPVFWD